MFVLVGLYVAMVLAANLIIEAEGPAAVLYVSFALVGPIFTIRDWLHRSWEHLTRLQFSGRMGAIITTGAVASYLVNADAGKVALASLVAFAAAEVADTVVYALMKRYPLDARVNTSNITGAVVDSVLFPTIAFGAVLFSVSFTQFVAKVAGGVVWLLFLRYLLQRREVLLGNA